MVAQFKRQLDSQLAILFPFSYMYMYVAIKFVCVCVSMHGLASGHARLPNVSMWYATSRDLDVMPNQLWEFTDKLSNHSSSTAILVAATCLKSVSKHLWKSKDGSWRWFSMATRRVQKISWRFLMLMKDLVSTFFTVCSTATIILCELFFSIRQPTPRNKSTLKKPRCRTERFKNSFIKFCSGPQFLILKLCFYLHVLRAPHSICVPIKWLLLLLLLLLWGRGSTFIPKPTLCSVGESGTACTPMSLI